MSINYKLAAETAVIKKLITEVYPTGIVSLVSDSYDFWGVISKSLPKLKADIMARQPDALGLNKVVVRPDSGCPVKIICGYKISTQQEWDEGKETEVVVKDGKYYSVQLFVDGEDYEDIFSEKNLISEAEVKGAIECLWDIFGGTINDKGYKVLDPHIGLIYGDSITLDRAKAILEGLKAKGFCSTNVVFGIGSYTYQYITRDTFGWAVKATAGKIAGKHVAIQKDPITDKGSKKSASGYLIVDEDQQGNYQLWQNCAFEDAANNGCLETVFRDGVLQKDLTFAQIRANL